MPQDCKSTKTLTAAQARSSIRSLQFELTNLTPSSLVTLFEIDMTNILTANEAVSLSSEASNANIKGSFPDNTLRFHNNIKVFNSEIQWQGKRYYPAPIDATGFENSSKGTLPTPILSISSQSKEGMEQLSLLKHEILKFGDIIGAKVTRHRTFAKYLDWNNFEFNPDTAKLSPNAQELPQGYEPDPNAELPLDIYYIERKTAENKATIQYQLSSILDLEGTKIPRRIIIADKCNWQYRGPGCWYQHAYRAEEEKNNIPILRKADLTKKDFNLPRKAPAVASIKDEKIYNALDIPLKAGGESQDKGPWKGEFKGEANRTEAYAKGDYVYIEKDEIKYYYVAKEALPIDLNKKNPPPNQTYWMADQCSKTLNGCRLRWGPEGSASPGTDEGACPIGFGKGLPFGGFPAARKVAGGR